MSNVLNYLFTVTYSSGKSEAMTYDQAFYALEIPDFCALQAVRGNASIRDAAGNVWVRN